MNEIEFQITGDGSPTAYHVADPIDKTAGEAMHHTEGALGESIYVFGPAIQWGFQNKLEPRFLSIGLGLGYLEFFVAAYCLQDNEPKTKQLSNNFYLESYESDSTLIQNLVQYVNGTPNAYTKYYDLIVEGIEKVCSVSAEDVVQTLLDAYEEKTWVIHSSLNSQTPFLKKFDVIMYDLYSAKTLENLWTEEFLTDFITKTAANSCAFATYASKGTLKRSLKSNNFQIDNRPGYKGKRESIIAFK